MRNAFAAAITRLAAADSRVVLLSGDIGNRLFDDYKKNFPDRYYNCGVAEANMVGVAAGLALCGLRPFVYTITPFVTTRVMEQIRVDLCYQNLPVTLVGTGSGLAYYSLGPTHHSCEDIAMLRAIPNMTIICPADSTEIATALPAILHRAAPTYLRIGKKGEPAIHSTPPKFEIGKGILLRQGTDICLIATGIAVSQALEAAQSLNATVISLHTIKPLDEDLIISCFHRYKLIAVIEEHSAIGGLFSAISELLTRRRIPTDSLISFATPDEFLHPSGSPEFARQKVGLTAAAIAARILKERNYHADRR